MCLTKHERGKKIKKVQYLIMDGTLQWILNRWGNLITLIIWKNSFHWLVIILSEFWKLRNFLISKQKLNFGTQKKLEQYLIKQVFFTPYILYFLIFSSFYRKKEWRWIKSTNLIVTENSVLNYFEVSKIRKSNINI